MSNISTIYDQIRSQMALLMPTMTEIPNPYSLPDNMIQFLENGWGVVIGDSSAGVIDVLCLDSEVRTFTIFVTKAVYNLDGTNTNLVSDSKSIMEKIKTIKDDFLAWDQLGIPDTIQKIDFQGSTGIGFVNGEKFNLFYSSISFGIEYTNNILMS